MAACYDHCYLPLHKVSRHCGSATVVTLCPAKFDSHVLAIDVADLGEALPELSYDGVYSTRTNPS